MYRGIKSSLSGGLPQRVVVRMAPERERGVQVSLKDEVGVGLSPLDPERGGGNCVRGPSPFLVSSWIH